MTVTNLADSLTHPAEKHESALSGFNA